GLAHVGGDEVRVPAGRRGRRLGLVAPADHDLGARLEQALRDRAPDAASAAGHDRDPPGEVDRDAHGRRSAGPSPIAPAIRSRCQAGVPSQASIERARLRWRCTSYSQVKPTPPWIWSASAAQRKYASEHQAFASDAVVARSSSCSAAAQPAYQAAERAVSTCTIPSAHLCLIAWNEPIGRPNCTRSLAW